MKVATAVLLSLSTPLVLSFSSSDGAFVRHGVSQQGHPRPLPRRRVLNLASVGRRFENADNAMSDFFLAKSDWHPIFRSLALDSTVPAMSFLMESPAVLVNEEDILDTAAYYYLWSSSSSISSNTPWKQLDAIPTGESERQVVAGFLDAMQQALLDIPCISEEEDEFDAQFIEEGRRMLAVSRFQVLTRECDLFNTCWNELFELNRLDEPNTGSLIVLPPGYNVEELESFTDANLLQPLKWLGLHTSFEISSITRGNPAVRLLHKLSDIPTRIG